MVRKMNEADKSYLTFDEMPSVQPCLLKSVEDAESKDLYEYGLLSPHFYYIIQNGVRFTGMPAFGEGESNLDDKESWALVHFIRHLPAMTDDEVAEMKGMNPKSPGQLKKEEEIRKFLEGDDTAPAGNSHQHQH